MSARIKAVSYVRMSTDKQETSPGQQREAIADLAKKEGYEIVSAYEDLGVSGSDTEKRTDFRRMIVDGSMRKFETILCWDQDRFGRFDLIEAGKWIDPLKNAGVSLHTVTAGKIDWTTLAGQLGYMASQLGKAQYLRDLSANIRRGQSTVENAGKWTRGFAPFGYLVDKETGKLIPGDPADVRILRAIFERYATGSSQRELCVWLASQGIKTRRGNNWQPQSIRHTLNNMVYRGHLAYGKSSASRFLPYGTPDGSRIDRPRSDWNVMHNTHPPLISDDLFDRCQVRREENKTMTGPGSRDQYALTGLLFCGNCGRRMGGTTDNSKRYICTAYQDAKEGCDRRTVKESDVLPQVVKAIRENFIDKYFGIAEREAIKEAMRRKLLDHGGNAIADRKRNEKRLSQVEGELEQAINAMLSTSEDLRPLVEKRVRTMQDERSELVDILGKQTAPAAEQVAQAELRIDAAIGWLDRLEELVNTEFKPRALTEMLRQFIERIEVDIERTPQGKRSVNRLVGGRVFFRAESFPAWVIPETESWQVQTYGLVNLAHRGPVVVISWKTLDLAV